MFLGCLASFSAPRSPGTELKAPLCFLIPGDQSVARLQEVYDMGYM